MRTIWANLGNLIVVILLSPLFIILIGPFLVLAALRGYQPMGPITLNTSRYGPPGRIGGLALGLVLWGVVWGGLAWVIINGLLRPPSTIANSLPAASPTATITVDLETATPLPPSPTLTPSPTATATTRPLTPTPILTLTITAVFEPTATPTSTPSPTPTLTPTATATLTPTTVTTTPTLTPTAEAVEPPEEAEATDLDLVETVRPTPLPPLSPEDIEAVRATVKEGNVLLWAVITTANEETVQNLENVWQGAALTKAEEFATERYDRYEQPAEVQFQYIIPPRITEQSAADQVIVVSQERWFYTGDTTDQQETFEFVYTLQREEAGWVITGYTYDAP